MERNVLNWNLTFGGASVERVISRSVEKRSANTSVVMADTGKSQMSSPL